MILHKEKYKDNHIVSPCRAICKICKKKKVHGYSNPDHVCNPFGYLYLFPVNYVIIVQKKKTNVNGVHNI